MRSVVVVVVAAALFIAVANVVALAANLEPVLAYPVALVGLTGWAYSLDVIRNKIGAGK